MDARSTFRDDEELKETPLNANCPPSANSKEYIPLHRLVQRGESLGSQKDVNCYILHQLSS